MMIHLCNSYETELLFFFFDNMHLKTLAETSDVLSTQSSSEIPCRCLKGNPVVQMYP